MTMHRTRQMAMHGTRRARGLVLASLLAVVPAATAALAQSPPVSITDAWARRAPAAHGAGASANGAVYMTITNRSPDADALVAATSEAAKIVELHEVRHEGGVMAMRPVPRMPLPAGGRLELKPGGYHVMLMGLTRHLNPGDTVTVTLTFEKAPPLTIEAAVR
jgi:copper(I)-binding protein